MSKTDAQVESQDDWDDNRARTDYTTLLRRRKAFRIAPIYDKHTDSMIIYIKDVPSFARYHNEQITFFLDRNDESLVGLEITGCKQLINNSDDNGINLGEKS